MNQIATFRLCTLTDSELLQKVDEATDSLYTTGKIPMRHIPARPDEDYDLLVGELISRYKERMDAVQRPTVAQSEKGETVEGYPHLRYQILVNLNGKDHWQNCNMRTYEYFPAKNRRIVKDDAEQATPVAEEDLNMDIPDVSCPLIPKRSEKYQVTPVSEGSGDAIKEYHKWREALEKAFDDSEANDFDDFRDGAEWAKQHFV